MRLRFPATRGGMYVASQEDERFELRTLTLSLLCAKVRRFLRETNQWLVEVVGLFSRRSQRKRGKMRQLRGSSRQLGESWLPHVDRRCTWRDQQAIDGLEAEEHCQSAHLCVVAPRESAFNDS